MPGKIDFQEAPIAAAENPVTPVAQGFGSAKQIDFQPVEQAAPEAPPEQSTGMKVLQGAGRVLDYPGGLARTAVAAPFGVVGAEDVSNAFKGQAPNSAEYMTRMGMTKGPSIELPYVGEITTRGVEGFALDVALDPLSAITKLTKEVPYIGKLINAPGAAAEAVGEAAYKSGLKGVDAKLVEKGGQPVSDVLLQHGVTGTSAQIEKKAQELGQTMAGVRKGLYDKADQLGVNVNLKDMEFENAQKVLEKMKRDPQLTVQAEHLEDMISKYKATGEAPISQVSEWKTNLNDALPKQAFDKNGKALTMANQMKQALASDFKTAIVDTGNKAEHGLGDAIDHVNSQWGPLLNAQNPLAKQAKQAAGGSIGTWIDGVLAGSGHIPALAGKKALELANTTYLRTKVGKALLDAGHAGLIDDLTRRGVINAARPDVPVAPEALQPNPPQEPQQ